MGNLLVLILVQTVSFRLSAGDKSPCQQGKCNKAGHGLIKKYYSSEDKARDAAKFIDELLLLHPSLMQLTGICIGVSCIVNQTTVMVAWPCPSLPLSGVGVQDSLLSQLGVVRGQLISIQSHDRFSAASLVELSPVNK